MKKIFKVFLMIIVIGIMFNSNICKAYTNSNSGTYSNSNGGTGTSDSSVQGLGDLNDYKGDGGESKELQKRAGGLLGGIQIIGTVTSVVMLTIIGIKYMLGSVEEKADYKSTLVPYVVGALLIFTGTLVPQLIYTFMKNF